MLYNFNGSYSQKPALEPTNRSFLYGDGFFESMCLFNGQLFNKKHHIRRIQDSLSVLCLELDVSASDLVYQVEELAQKNDLSTASSARLSVFRNEGGLYTPSTKTASFLINVRANSQQSFAFSDGISLGLCTDFNKMAQPLSFLKSSSALTYVMASIEKQKQGFDELILLNQFSKVVEVTNANIFIVKGNRFYTPPLSDGGVDGTMRALLMDHFSHEKKSLTVEDAIEADEIILCNYKGIRWVNQFMTSDHYVNHKSIEIVSLLNTLI